MKFIAICLVFWLIWQGSALFFFSKKRELNFSDEKKIFVLDDGVRYVLSSEKVTIADLVDDFDFDLKEDDLIYPNKDRKLLSGMTFEIWRSNEFEVSVDDKEIIQKTFAKTVKGVLNEANVVLGRLDKVSPAEDEILEPGEEIIVTRINVENVVLNQKIEFKTVKKNDRKMKWRTKKVEQEGVEGEKRVEHKITYKNGKEISREVLSSETLKKPVDEIIRIGTKVELGKTHKGWGTWYDQGPHPKLRARYPFEGDMFAASPWLPLGSYAKVTNRANGKSVIVRINDRGPFGPNRIIDLHKPAFQKIASLGAGVLEVKVSEIKQ